MCFQQKKSLHVENERMVKSVKKSAQQAERLTAELEAGNKRQQKLRDRIAKLEAGLEKVCDKIWQCVILVPGYSELDHIFQSAISVVLIHLGCVSPYGDSKNCALFMSEKYFLLHICVWSR